MRRTATSLAILFTVLCVTPAGAQRYCDGCSVLEEYGMSGFQIGGHYRLDGGEPAIVDQVDTRTNQVLIHFPGFSNSPDWVRADRLYTDQHAFERGQKAGLASSCAIYAAADGFLAALFRGACCESSAAKRYGTPPGLC
ncbi:MAG: hypothetical protein WDN03_14685 [Rhizomicrobium sp.]